MRREIAEPANTVTPDYAQAVPRANDSYLRWTVVAASTLCALIGCVVPMEIWLNRWDLLPTGLGITDPNAKFSVFEWLTLSGQTIAFISAAAVATAVALGFWALYESRGTFWAAAIAATTSAVAVIGTTGAYIDALSNAYSSTGYMQIKLGYLISKAIAPHLIHSALFAVICALARQCR